MAHWKGLLLGATLAALTLASQPASADPWAKTGDIALRHDLRLLADAGILTTPANTWPIPWAAISGDLDRARPEDLDDPAVAAARARMKARISRVQGLKGLQPNGRLAARTEDFWLRTFEDTPRDEGEARIGGSWMGDRFAARLQISYANDPLPDDQEWRADGSYVAGTFGNHVLSVGAIDRWWGPSSNDSLILSSNARPVAGIALERSTAKAFETKWLSWIGPWRYTLLWGALGNDTEPEDAQLVAFRVDVRPLESLEIGLTRTAQWCGNDRPCDGETFVDLVLGRDNVGSSGIDDSNEPGNQLAAADFRWQAPLIDGPWALYAQAVGEDEAGGLPSKLFGQGGIEFWGALDNRFISGSWRAHLEYMNSTARFTASEPDYNTAYEHGTYTTGYRFERRALGAAADGDSDLVSLGVTLVEDSAHSWNGLVRAGTINKKGAAKGIDLRHTVSPEELEVVSAQLSHKRAIEYSSLDLGTISLGVGVQYSDNQVTGASDTDAQAFVTWTWDYSGL